MLKLFYGDDEDINTPTDGDKNDNETIGNMEDKPEKGSKWS